MFRCILPWSMLIGWSNVADGIGWLTAPQALARLQVRPQTLYAYVSRGRVQARPDPADPRRSLYSKPDVERLALSSRTVRRPSAVAASAIAWGEPMLASAISTVHAGRLIYRGADAVDLAMMGTLEEAAALLWGASPEVFAVGGKPSTAGGGPLSAVFAFLSSEASSGASLLARTPRDLHAEGARLLFGLSQAVAGVERLPGEKVHAQLARGWGTPEATDILRRALVLLADHELNVSTFATRVAASSGAPLAACLLSGLCALAGPRHGRAALATSALVSEVGRIGVAAALKLIDIEAGAPLPGFGHPLYAGVDPRAAALLETFRPPALHGRLRAAVARRYGRAPNVDYALSAITARFALPDQAPFLIFALARSAGWIAHALEQVSSGELIRPRARYVGVLPQP